MSPVTLTATVLLLLAFPQPISEFFVLMWGVMFDFARHYMILLPAVLLGLVARWQWLENKSERLKILRSLLRHVIPIVLVLTIFGFSKYDTVHSIRAQVVQDARAKVDRAFASVQTEVEATPNSYPASQLITLSQGIGKITTRTFDLVQNAYPRFDLRTLSVFLHLGADCDEAVLPGCVEDVIQEGELEKDRRYFPYSSLVGATIHDGVRYYCPDLLKVPMDGDCKKFQPPPAGLQLEFASVLCYPVPFGDRNESSSHDGERFAAVCLDSKSKHAFDGQEDNAWETIRNQIGRLAALLHEFKRIRTDRKLWPLIESSKSRKAEMKTIQHQRSVISRKDRKRKTAATAPSAPTAQA